MCARAQVQWGIKAGVNISNIIETGLTPEEAKFSTYRPITEFNAGLLASIPFCSQLFLQPEVIYSMQGGINNSITVNYYYLNIPVLCKYQHHSGLFVETGPQIGFLLNSNLAIDGLSIQDKNNRNTDFSWVFGLGYKMPKMNLGIDARYNLGLTTVNKPTGDHSMNKNSVFQFDIFYLFSKF